MTKQIERILLGVLWMLAATLGISFWFSINFGFNIFSAAHWQYLAYLQASQTPVHGMFYISLIISVIIMLGGLYIILRPRLRKIHAKPQTKKDIPLAALGPRPQSVTAPAPMTAIEIPNPPPAIPASKQPQETHTPQPGNDVQSVSGIGTKRPPRLNMPMANKYAAAPAPTPKPQPQKMELKEYPEINEIFESNGFVVKKAVRIADIPIALLAIGTNETLWIGTVGVATTDLHRAIDTIGGIFTDTLEDIDININGFAIAAPDADTSEFEDIRMFDTISELGEYIKTVPNPPPEEDEAENFAAYSEYIDTVITYIGKL